MHKPGAGDLWGGIRGDVYYAIAVMISEFSITERHFFYNQKKKYSKKRIKLEDFSFFCPKVALRSKRQAKWVSRMTGRADGLADGRWHTC